MDEISSICVIGDSNREFIERMAWEIFGEYFRVGRSGMNMNQ